MHSPLFSQSLNLIQRIAYFAIQELITQLRLKPSQCSFPHGEPGSMYRVFAPVL